MKPKKTTSKQLAKKSAKKPKQDKAPTKGNTRKRQVSDGSDDSDDDIAQSRPKRKQQKKSKHVEEVDEEETEATEPEEIVESDDDEEPEGNDKVSQLQMIVRNNDNSPDKRMKNWRNNTN